MLLGLVPSNQPQVRDGIHRQFLSEMSLLSQNGAAECSQQLIQ